MTILSSYHDPVLIMHRNHLVLPSLINVSVACLLIYDSSHFCSSNMHNSIFFQNLPLYADIDGKQFPVTSSPDSDHRQVSWSVNGKSQARLYNVR